MHLQQPEPTIPSGPVSDPAELCSCTAESLSSLAGSVTLLRVGGEVDLFSLPVLESALDAALDQRPVDLVVDLAGLTFCSARGVSLLLHTAHTATEAGVGYAVSAVPPLIERLWTEFWPGELPKLHPSAAVAVTAIRSRRVD